MEVNRTGRLKAGKGKRARRVEFVLCRVAPRARTCGECNGGAGRGGGDEVDFLGST